jgi:hypothetical protein
MTRVGLGVGGERKPHVLNVGLARKPPLLFRHRRGVSPEKSQSVESVVEHESIQLSRLRLLNDLPPFIESLQGEQAVAEFRICAETIRSEAEGFSDTTRWLCHIDLVRCTRCPDGDVLGSLAGSSQFTPEMSVPLSPLPRLHSNSTRR